ncbi:MAG: type II secretion system F family protein [Candidatus Aenigmatarchaeota archaeon]
MKKEEILSIIIIFVFSAFLLIFNNLFLSRIFNFFILNFILNLIGIFLPLIIVFIIFSQKNKRIKEIEFYFSSFLRDLAESLRSGRSIVKILEVLKDNDYKALSPLIKKMYNEVKLGISFEKALENLAKRSESKLIRRLSITIGEGIKAGGDVASLIEAIIRSYIEIEKVRREREMISSPTKIQGFMIYFMFLLIMVIIIKFLLPSITSSQQIKIDLKEINNILLHLVLIQSFFNGLLIGKISEGNVLAGLRYSIILMIFGYIVFSSLSAF